MRRTSNRSSPFDTALGCDAQDIKPILDAIHGSERPVLYVGGGCLDASAELREFVEATGIPVAQTLMGLGTFPETHPLALQVLPSSEKPPFLSGWDPACMWCIAIICSGLKCPAVHCASIWETICSAVHYQCNAASGTCTYGFLNVPGCCVELLVHGSSRHFDRSLVACEHATLSRRTKVQVYQARVFLANCYFHLSLGTGTSVSL